MKMLTEPKKEEFHEVFHEFHEEPFDSKCSAKLLHCIKIKESLLSLLTDINYLLKEHQL